MSDVEKFYYAVQAKLGGNLKWEELTGEHQRAFVHGVNLIKAIAEARK